jgi:hypothetical protein
MSLEELARGRLAERAKFVEEEPSCVDSFCVLDERGLC